MRRAVLLLPVFACSATPVPPAGPATAKTTTNQPPKPAPPPDDPAFAPHASAKLAVGDGFACVVHAGGRVACWGDNSAGQLGRGDTLSFIGARDVPGLDEATAVAAGSRHACALRKDETVWCWGSGKAFRLGSQLEDKPYPARPVPEVTHAIALAVGDDHSCAVLRSGKLRCWGSPERGRLGLDHYDHVTEPTNVLLDVDRVTGVALGAETTCVRDGSGRVHCWGTGEDEDANQRVTLKGVDDVVELISNGNGSTCARSRDKSLRCWSTSPEPTPSMDDDNNDRPDAPHRHAFLGEHRCVALATDVSCTGEMYVSHHEYDVGDEETPARPALPNVSELQAFGETMCALTGEGAVHCWGSNEHGQLGVPPGGTWPTPQKVGLVSGAVALDGRDDEMCSAVTGGVRCWGADFQLENHGLKTIRGATQLSVGADHACALLTGGRVACWGDADAGQLGRAAEKKVTPKPGVGVLGVLSASNAFGGRDPSFVAEVNKVKGARAVSASGATSCALTAAGVMCWGATGLTAETSNPEACNRFGVIGLFGSKPKHQPDEKSCDQQKAPRLVPNSRGATLLAAAHSGHCMIDSKGDLSCWDAGPPTRVAVTDAVSVHSGHDTTCALTQAGALRCWGGDGRAKPNTTFSVPLVDWSSGDGFECGVTQKGLVLCAGKGHQGQLGNGATLTQTSPQPVIGITQARHIRAGERHACALVADKSVWCWGEGDAHVGVTSGVLRASRRPVAIKLP